MTGEEAIKAAERLAKELHALGHSDEAATWRTVVSLARTGLLVERTLASHREIVLWKFEPGNAPPSVVIGTDMDQCGSCDTELAHGPTLPAAVEVALKGTP